MPQKASAQVQLLILTFATVTAALTGPASLAQQSDAIRLSALRASVAPAPATVPNGPVAHSVHAKKSATNAPDSQPVSFEPAVTYSSGGYIVQGLAIADVNGDGKPDIIALNWWGPGTAASPGVVGVLLGNGNGTFQPVVTYETAAQHGASVVVEDVNGDGKPDVLVTSCASTENTCGSTDGVMSVLLGNGNGTFQNAVTYSSGAPGAVGIAVSDLRSDGVADVIVANSSGGADGNGSVAVLLGNGDGTFQSPVLYDSGSQQANNLVAADINGDGIPDLIVANLCDSCSGGVISVLLGNGNGTFQPAVTFASGSNNSDLAVVADVNGDGVPDLIISNINYDGAYGMVSVLLGLGHGTFAAPVAYNSGGWAAVDVAVADVNGDGKPDIVVANCGPVDGCGNGTIGVLLGDGTGTFQPAVDFYSGAYNATQIAVADLNGDGKPDIVAGNQCLTGIGYSCPLGSVAVLLNGVAKSPTSTTLTSSLNPSTYGQSVTWTATVATTGSIPPTGKVNFNWTLLGETYNIGAATLNSSGVATLTRSTLSADLYPLNAVYLGDTNNLGSTSPVFNQTVQQVTSSATLTSSPNPSIAGQSVTFTADITSPTVVPAGPVTFTQGKTTLATVELMKGKATFTTSTLPAGSNMITVTYPWNSDIASSSASVVQSVTSTTGISTTTTLSSSANPSPFGQELTFTARVSSSSGTPANGEIVTFSSGSTILGPGVLSGGVATLTTSALPGGTSSITASYPGDAIFLASTSSPLSQQITTTGSSAVVTWAANPPTNETFTATVTGPKGTPTGSVTFTVGNTVLGSSSLNKGVATLTVATLIVGSNTVTATYSGDQNNSPTSAWTTQTFVMPYNATMYLQQEGGSAAASTEFGTGAWPTNFVQGYSGLPNNPDPTGQVRVGTFDAGTIVNFGVYSVYGSQTGWAFSDEVGNNQAALVSFADLSNSLGLNHAITQQTSSTTWVLWLDDALSYQYDDDNNDAIIEIILVAN